jgi:N-acetylneuraminic acid mutarotase
MTYAHTRTRTVKRLLGLALISTGLLAWAVLLPEQAWVATAQTANPSWSYTGSLNRGRVFHTATLLPNGKVLVAGGDSLGSAELYDPATGTWRLTGSLNTPRGFDHTATLLPNGKVLVAGGYNGDEINSAELYDPATGTWTSTGNLNVARHSHTATLLPDGKVLVAGGGDEDGGITNSAELYNPATGTWSITGSLHTVRGRHTATLLPDSRVLVAGGTDSFFPSLRSSELYDPHTGTWSVTGSLNTDRVLFTATLLSNGSVLVAGGESHQCSNRGCGFSGVTSSAELYNPATGTWSYTGDLSPSRGYHTATLLPNGQVLVAGGVMPGFTSINSAEIYDPATGNWSSTASLNTTRSFHTATLLSNGKVLVVGGAHLGNVLSSAELYDSGSNLFANPIDDPAFFVRQQYLDFLGREPEPGGFQGWLNILNNCGTSVQQPCDRIEVSSAFFRSEEFQSRGYFVYRFYSTLGRIPHYSEFMPDLAKVSGFLTPEQLEANKAAFVQEFMARQEFQTRYGPFTDPTTFVYVLLQTTGLPGHPMKGAWIAGLTQGTMTRAEVLRALVESSELYYKKYNEAFVVMEYFGYLRRDPDILYFDWIQTMSLNGGDYREMINGFINSAEYRQRFGH